MTEERDEHDRHMDALASRISNVCHDEQGFDVAMACSVIAAFALRTCFDNQADRESAVIKLIDLMMKVIEDGEGNNGHDRS